MDEVRLHGLIDRERLELCERIYREAGETAKSEACRATRVRYVPEPADEPLWK
jgi:hypothetical protein